MLQLETGPEERYGHVAVHFGNYILVFGGRYSKNYDDLASMRMIWLHDVHTERWRKYIISCRKMAPPAMEKASGVAIERTVYMFGGWVYHDRDATNAVWKLTWTPSGCIHWSGGLLRKKHKTPSPRYGHTAWQYEGKLWVFGGYGYHPDSYLNECGDFMGVLNFNFVGCNNQLLSYNPVSEEWTNLNCLGSVPEPRFECTTTIDKDRVYMFGGRNSSGSCFDDLYELRMHSFTWIQIQTDQTRPQGQLVCTLNSLFGSQLELHCRANRFKYFNERLNDTWVFDLPSQSWRQYKCTTDDNRWRHTRTKCTDGNIISIGGTSKCNPAYNFTFHIKLGPKTLQQLVMKTIFKHRTELVWKCLPKKLIAQLGLSEILEEPDNKSVHSNSNAV